MPTLAFDLDGMDEDYEEEEEKELLPEDENCDDLYDEIADQDVDDVFCPMCKSVIEDGEQCPVCGFIVGV